MTGVATVARQEAIDWAIRARDAAFDDWEALADWLAADPHHAELYDAVTIAADEGARAPRVSTPAADTPVVVQLAIRQPRRWVPLALAASLVAMVGGGIALYRGTTQPAYYSVATSGAARHSVDLPGAVLIELNGDTSITLDHNDPRFARLDRGEALFTVVHDSKRPFALHVGNTVVTDVGTVFDVEQDATGVRVAVADGAVRVTTLTGAIAVTAGTSVAIGTSGDTTVRRDQDVGSVGAWRDRQIDFADITLARLAARVHRASGADIVVKPEIAGRRVSGSVALVGDGEAVLRGLGPALGVTVRRRGNNWVWSGAAGAGPS